MSASVLAPVRPLFRAAGEAIVPEAAGLDEPGWRAVEAIVEAALAQRPGKVRRQLRLLLRLIDVLALCTTGRRFIRLDPSRRLRLLFALQNAPVLLLRRGTWGLRTLVFMGYYARPEGAVAVGYRADPRGWEARR